MGRTPAFTPPPGACDAHFHVFGPSEHYGYAGELRYGPPYAPLDAYMALSRTLGFDRFVLVQPSAYGLGNACMLDAMRQIGTARCRGIVDMEEAETPRATLLAWHRPGVRGIRVNVSPVRKPEVGLADSMRPRIRRLGEIAWELDWHLDFLTPPGWLVQELLPDIRARRRRRWAQRVRG